MKYVLILRLVVLAACTDPRVNADVVVGPDGVTVNPTASGSVGGVGVTVHR